MRRARLRTAHTPEELAALYAAPYDSSRWRDHIVRVEATIALGLWFPKVSTIGDLSTGDAAIPKGLQRHFGSRLILGDFAPGYEYRGPIEDTITQIPSVDLFVLAETLEHLDDPDGVLRLIRTKCRRLLMSTPIDEFTPKNETHYWGWDKEEVGAMLAAAGFQTEVQSDIYFPSGLYDYQIWGCK